MNVPWTPASQASPNLPSSCLVLHHPRPRLWTHLSQGLHPCSSHPMQPCDCSPRFLPVHSCFVKIACDDVDFSIMIISPKGPSFVNVAELLFTGELLSFLRHLWRAAVQDTYNQPCPYRIYQAYCVHPEQLFQHPGVMKCCLDLPFEHGIKGTMYPKTTGLTVDQVQHSVLYICHWKIPLKIIAALLMVKKMNMWWLESSDYSFLPLKDRQADRCLLLLQFPSAVLVLDKPAKCSQQTKHLCFLHCS